IHCQAERLSEESNLCCKVEMLMLGDQSMGTVNDDLHLEVRACQSLSTGEIVCIVAPAENRWCPQTLSQWRNANFVSYIVSLLASKLRTSPNKEMVIEEDGCVGCWVMNEI
ncbi:hypothetical protein GOP47_0005375, partial [Adiantum capillus-veneris]